MNKLFVLFVFVSVALMSCDGRDRIHKPTEVALEENKLLESFSENIKYFPETYSEIETDTLLGNGFRVNIKFFSDMENSYLDEFKVDTITHKHFYRDYKSKITVTYKDTIFDEQIDKDFILKLNPENSNFFKTSVFSNIWLDVEQSLANSNTTINILYCKPETDWCAFFRLIIDEKGQYSIEDVTEEMEEGL